MFAQGDILLVPVPEVPAEFTAKLPKSPVIVGYGEASGHSHVMVGDVQWLTDALTEIELSQFANAQPVAQPVFVQVGDGVRLAHLDAHAQPTADHAAIDIPAGTYQVIRQRELSLVDDRVRYVAD